MAAGRLLATVLGGCAVYPEYGPTGAGHMQRIRARPATRYRHVYSVTLER